jgi:hypothetical protein
MKEEEKVKEKSIIPAGAKKIPLRPLALGEATGHNHRLISDGAVAVEDACELYEVQEEGVKKHFLRVTADGISLIHADGDSLRVADHQTVPVAPGEYPIVIQEEETDWGRQRVLD